MTPVQIDFDPGHNTFKTIANMMQIEKKSFSTETMYNTMFIYEFRILIYYSTPVCVHDPDPMYMLKLFYKK